VKNAKSVRGRVRVRGGAERRLRLLARVRARLDVERVRLREVGLDVEERAVLAERVEVEPGLDDVRAQAARGEVVQAGEVPLERDVLARREDGEVGGVLGLCEVVERVLDLRRPSAPPSHRIQNRVRTQSPLNFARAPVLAFRKSKLCVRASARTEWGSLRSLSVRFPEFIRLTVSRRPLPSSHAAAGPVTDTASARCGKQKEKMPARA
jgi:hypothetical protein